MGMLKYKGYVGSVEYSEEDDCLFGKVQGMNQDAITYEGQSIDELRHDFEGAIEEYLQSCAERGVEPKKAYTGTLNIRISPETHSLIAARALEQGKSINAFIRAALDRAAVLL